MSVADEVRLEIERQKVEAKAKKKIIKEGFIKKKSMLFYKKRYLVLTNQPKLVYYEANKQVLRVSNESFNILGRDIIIKGLNS
jgi:hypothetical protein